MVTIKSEADINWQIFNQISEFVKNKENWEKMWVAAERLIFSGASGVLKIDGDHRAPQRIQVGLTILHQHTGLMYANAFRYNSTGHPSKKDLIQTINDVQRLIDAATEVRIKN